MNNGKVRIYELSKELDLDNKELLAICNGLNIAVKSHSSTITESDAERIRTQAEKLAATNMMSKKTNTPQSGGRHNPAAPKKQQILEIRSKPKQHNTQADVSDPASNRAVAPNKVTPPSPPRQTSPPVSPMKPAAPIRPVPRNQSETTDVPQNSSKSIDSGTDSQLKKTEPPATKPAQREKTPKPQLVAPPSRPSAQKPGIASDDSPQPQHHAVEKPILKRERIAGKSVAKGADIQSTPAKPTRSAPPAKGEKVNKTPTPTYPSTEVQKPRIPSRPEPPARPIAPAKPPGRSPDLDTSMDEDEGDRSDTVDEILELRRPTPPRPPKVGKKRIREEEIDEGKEKAGKAVKNKRLKPIVEDEFDDDLLDDEDSETSKEALAISNAIVRPPKPKSAKSSQPVQTPSAPTTKGNRKPSHTRSDKSNNRRETVELKPDIPEKIVATGSMTVQELADATATPDTEIVKILFMQGIAVSITQSLDLPTIELVTQELGISVETPAPVAEARKVTEMLDVEDLEKLQQRPPVVTIMGHVDHGKTTLLDSIRKTKVAAGEAGGITQHIGAYHVDVEHDGKQQQVVFLDTPGHEAFTAMRARGARVTDIAILVVAADDGVRPQTIEAISHAQAAGVPIIVAINKIDKEGAQPDRVKQELGQYGLTPEEWGGETIMVPVSAIKGENLDTLLEMILLVAEIEDLHANPDRLAKGTVIEAHLDKAKGAVATLLIQNGTLQVGDILVAGPAFGKVRAMVDDRGKRVEDASPSFAVEVLGLSDVPAAGDEFEVFPNEREARLLATSRVEKQRQSRLLQGGRVTLTSISAQAQEGELKELNLIVKADVQGSLEAIIGSLKQIPQNEVQIRLLLSAPGEITETDIDLAAASGAVIIGFNTTFASGARQAADEAGVDVREYNIIYKLLEDIQGALEGLLEPELVEEPLGIAEVRAVFPVGRGAVAGCYVQSGKLLRNCKVRVRRGNDLVYEGALDSLKRMRDDVREVSPGYECGVGIDKFSAWTEGDSIEAYQMVTKRRTLAMATR